jgi:hypothetical protein
MRLINAKQRCQAKMIVSNRSEKGKKGSLGRKKNRVATTSSSD